MRATVVLVASLLALAGAAAASSPSTTPAPAPATPPLTADAASCAAVPCGPIPVILTFKLPNTRELVFPDDGVIKLEGHIVYYFDVDQDGYGYDVENLPVATFRVPRTVPWVDVTVDPPEIPIPVDDPSYIQQEDPNNDPGQLKYEYTHPITITLTLREMPTEEQLEDALRGDGKYRILLAVTSNESTFEVAGVIYGLLEGYGVRDLRVLPESELDGLLLHGDPTGRIPGASLGVVLLAALGALGWAVTVRPRRE